MKLSYILLFLSIASNILHASQEQFIIRQLNYSDEQEIKQVCDIFKDEEIREKTNYKSSTAMLYTILTNHRATSKILIAQTYENPAQICGILEFDQRRKDKKAYLMTLAVKEEFRRRGIASALISDFEQNRIEPFVESIIIRPTEDYIYNNRPAMALFRKHNYQSSFWFGISKVIDYPEHSKTD